MSLKRTSFSLPEHMEKDLQDLADQESRSKSSMITIMIKEGFERRGIIKKAVPTTGKKVVRKLIKKE